MFSIITPTHNPQFIEETYASLRLQGDIPFEWIIVPSPEAASCLPRAVLADPRVRTVIYPGEPLLGAIKRFAFDQARGDILVELDHDDLLVPGALAAIGRQVDLGADFVYSDTASFMSDTMEPRLYDPRHGWTNYPISVYGRAFQVAESFELTARSLCDIAYAPDHVRCWTRKVYKAVGGHNPELIVGDDHDLICRTYLAGFTFASTGGCHYLYRIHSDNTVQKRHTLIQTQSHVNRDKYLRPLVMEWSRRNGHGCMLFQGCIDRKLQHDKSLGFIQIEDGLSNLPLAECIQFFNAAYDALVPGGWLLIDVPSADDPQNLMDDCQSYHSADSFEWYCNREYAELDPRIHCRFQYVHLSDEQGETDRWRVRAALSALKSQRQPGLCKI